MESPRLQIRRNPVPSLLTSLLTEHLDPGYAAAARSAQHSRRSRTPPILWLIVGAVVIGGVFGVAYAQFASAAPVSERARSDAADAVRVAESRGNDLDVTRDALAQQVSSARDEALRTNAAGNALLDRLTAAESAAGVDDVTGPGLSIVLAEPAAGSDTAENALPRADSSAVAVLDRDISSVVNSLWASGAEAIAVNGFRVGPNVTIRQAGGAMLVNDRPIFAPYRIDAIGPPERIQVQFVVSDAYLRMTTVSQLYGVGFSTRPATDLRLGPAVPSDAFFAREAGRP